jgi:nicotinate-nucleotide adenylyltransferase
VTLRLLYGGTFDPVHAGHLAVARAARDAFDTEVCFLPAADPPHRAPPGASAKQRARMIELAIAGEPGFVLDKRELHRPGPSYTADTLREFRRELGPGASVAWLIGADAFHGLTSWHDWRELFDLAHFVIAERAGRAVDDLEEPLRSACAGRWVAVPSALSERPAGGLYRLRNVLHPASATGAREALGAGHADPGWLAPAVAAYIDENGLYRPSRL